MAFPIGPKTYTPGEESIFHNSAWIYVGWPGTTTTAVPNQGDVTGEYGTLTRTGAGTYTYVTNDTYTGVSFMWGSVVLATPAGQWNICPGAPTKNANNTWTLPFTVFNAATATDIPVVAGNEGYFAFLARRGSQLP